MEVSKHSVKFPSRVGTVIGMIIAMSLSFVQFRLMDSLPGPKAISLYVLLSATVLACAVVLILAVISMSKQATDLQLYADKLVFNACTLQAKEIKMIMIRGYFRPVVGILPHGHKFVPMNMAFCYPKDEEDVGLSQLKNWADQNGVSMGHKWFRSWI